jgi:hypothetical protein
MKVKDDLKLLEGMFRIELIKDNKVIQSYEEHNQIQNYYNYLVSLATFGRRRLRIEDFIITGYAIGTDGVDSHGAPKKYLLPETHFGLKIISGMECTVFLKSHMCTR